MSRVAIDVGKMKHICWVGDSVAMVQDARKSALLTMTAVECGEREVKKTTSC
jgi:hypothetical protein